MGKPVGSRLGWMVRKIQFLLPKNGRESLELVLKMGFNEWYSNYCLEYSIRKNRTTFTDGRCSRKFSAVSQKGVLRLLSNRTFLVNNLNFLVLSILSLPGRVKVISRPVRPNDLTARLQGHRDESTCRKSLRKSLILVNPASREASKSRQQHKFCVFPNPALCFAQIRDPEGTLPDPVYSKQYRCLNSPLFHLFFHRACWGYESESPWWLSLLVSSLEYAGLLTL